MTSKAARLLTLHPKTTASGVGAVLAQLLINLVDNWYHLNTGQATSIVAILAFVFAWLAPWIPKPPAVTVSE